MRVFAFIVLAFWAMCAAASAAKETDREARAVKGMLGLATTVAAVGLIL